MNEFHQEQQRSNRQVYYVDVQARSLHTEPDIAAYHLVITANDYEVRQIQEKFRKLNARDEQSLQDMVMFAWADDENPVGPNNDSADREMKELFSILYERGTEETRNFIRSMNIL
ncbi:hypothetical protein [Paenibacillus camelliae]|uniref:hypothetical protein n=1 Tax=Paenibacillus camelliae TaxID=512410 RepID=UPI00203A51F1|nr:hypothetical protein [Paenibacillus camelliae]MCM3632496.1 hypothetical protein [Paenibacillus camelliae]